MTPENPVPAPTSATAGTSAEAKIIHLSSNPFNAKQRRALFDAAAQGMTPERIKLKPVDPALAWIPEILRKHKEGFSPRQIMVMAAAPGIELKLSVRGIRRLIAKHTKPAGAPAGPANR